MGGGKVVDRQNKQGLRQVKEDIRIGKSTYVMSRNPREYNQSSGNQSKSRDIKRSMSHFDDGSRWEPKLSQ